MFIQDAIYGLIKVSDLCVKFINTKEFQRLKRIKQLGNTFEVYPSGTHSRAEHCLGVMHISGAFYKSLIENSDGYEHMIKYKPLIELAGLLHDIGHGPKSHLFEEAMKIRNIPFSHEEYSLYLVEKINKRLCLLSQEQIEIIKNMILGKKMSGYPPFLFEIVANKDSGLDTDKMDYLVRDAHHIGKSTISVDYIIKHCRIDKYEHVSYSEKAVTDIRTLFANRKLMYEQVYFHKTVAKIDKMWICAMCQIDIDLSDPDFFLELDDSVLDYVVRYEINHDLIRCLDNRTLQHYCKYCPNVTLKRVAKLSGDTDNDPLLYIRFYNESFTKQIVSFKPDLDQSLEQKQDPIAAQPQEPISEVSEVSEGSEGSEIKEVSILPETSVKFTKSNQSIFKRVYNLVFNRNK